MTPNLALNSDCNEWQACRSHITNLSIHSFTCVSLPGYHAGSKSTLKSAVYILSNILLKWTKDRVRRLFVFYVYVLYFIMWSDIERDVYSVRSFD